jgi:hypothetical protein
MFCDFCLVFSILIARRKIGLVEIFLALIFERFLKSLIIGTKFCQFVSIKFEIKKGMKIVSVSNCCLYQENVIFPKM